MAMVERWRQETHTFHLPVGEMTVTLEDVSILLGLPIHGTPICHETNMPWEQVVERCLGVCPEGRAMANKLALSLKWLRETFSNLDAAASNDQIQKHARAYMLYMLGTILLVDLTGDSVSCIYLPLLENLNQVGSYAWGAAVLARLYRQLCHASAKDGKQIGGCLTLLQLWIWERVPPFRPKALSRHVLSGLAPDARPPRGFYWSARHKWLSNHRTLKQYRLLIDALQDENVQWMPYSLEIREGLPPSCLYQSRYWFSTATLIDFAIVETYHPDRVMRQFGLYQVIPPPNRSTLPLIHAIDRQKNSRTNWLEQHRVYIDEWYRDRSNVVREQRQYDSAELPRYLRWYNGATIPTFGAYIEVSSDGGPTLERVQRPELGIHKMVDNVIKFAKRVAKKLKTAVDAKFATDAFKMCREVVGTVDSIETFDRELRDVVLVSEEEDGIGSDEEEEAELNEEEEAESEEEDVAAEEEDDEADWGMTLTQARSQLTQVGPSSPKPCKKNLRPRK